MVRVGSTEGVVAAPEFLWSVKKSPLMTLFRNEIGLAETTLVTFRVVRFEIDPTLRVPTFARVAKTLVVVREFDTTRFGRVPGTEELTLDRKLPSPLKYVENTVFETFRSVNVPVPMGYPNEGAGVPERVKLI